MTLPSQPFEVQPRSLNAVQRLVDELRLYASRGFPLTLPLRDTDIPLNVDADGNSSLALPAWHAPEDGWVLRTAYLLVGSKKRSRYADPSLDVTVRIRSSTGSTDLGSFSSMSAEATAGVPLALGQQPLDRAVPRGAWVEVLVEQSGSPVMTASDAAVSFVFARTGA